ncbi:MBOAT family O-acyltransferase [Aureitalea marina]|uniref:Membrane-bound O-acyltransferase family protein n=1 Tax=Aureitalea marina TaxID=930804 RepID=A0A2S7KS72_9FLAO|nr:MBOAT family O-acyltransferase [Aureitalea marina]PQB05482.1 hypothetical protein BST85_11710 [Aureitalea marina]
MLFNSLDFALFFPVVFLLYWAFSGNIRSRNFFLTLASYFFYGWWDWRFLFLIAISSAVDFLVGRRLDQETQKYKRQLLLWLSISVNIGALVYFKYANFFVESFVSAFRLFGKEIEASTLDIILPVGISFYTFQTLSYTIDIYRKKIHHTKDAVAFFAFVSFFPQLVAGPIERASHLLPQFMKKHHFDYQAVRSGMILVFFGLFKKMVVADNVAMVVNHVYEDPSLFGGLSVIIATLCFAIQIYCDFSGYSDIAIGLARTMGFDLMKNFDSPYFSRSITEFWRRWHISLSTWFRDYVYIPLGGSRHGKGKTYLNLMTVFLVSGLWHGAAWTFVIWGGIHGCIIVAEKALGKQLHQLKAGFKSVRLGWLHATSSVVLTFAIVLAAWVFFRATNVDHATAIFDQSWRFYLQDFSVDWFPGLDFSDDKFIAMAVFVVALMFFELFHRDYGFSQRLLKSPVYVRWPSYLLIVFVIVIFGVYGEDQISEFIYFQF